MRQGSSIHQTSREWSPRLQPKQRINAYERFVALQMSKVAANQRFQNERGLGTPFADAKQQHELRAGKVPTLRLAEHLLQRRRGCGRLVD